MQKTLDIYVNFSERNIAITREERLETIAEDIVEHLVSPGQNEIDNLKQKGVDIEPHRLRMNRENLDTKFSDYYPISLIVIS